MLQPIGADARPITINVGTLQSFGQVTKSKYDAEKPDKVPYYMNTVQLKGATGSADAQFRFMWRPEWFSPSFRTATLDNGGTFVYKTNIAIKDGTSLLQGLCGYDGAWQDFQAQVGQLDDYTADTIDDFLRQYLLGLGSMPLIYEMRQERKKTGVDPATGKPIYVRGRFMEVTAVEHLTERYCKSLAKRLERNQNRIAECNERGEEPPIQVIAKFVPSDYGIDVELPQPAEPAWVTA